MQNQELWPEPHRRNASCSRPRSSSIYKDPPRTRQRTLILAAFLPWGGSDDTVTRRTGSQHTRFRPARAAATRRSASPQDCTPPTCRGAGAQHQDRAWLRCWWAVAMPGRASRRRTQVPPVWRAPEGPEGTGGLRDRPLRAAGSRVAVSRAAGPSGARNTSGAHNTRASHRLSH